MFSSVHSLCPLDSLLLFLMVEYSELVVLLYLQELGTLYH